MKMECFHYTASLLPSTINDDHYAKNYNGDLGQLPPSPVFLML